MLWSPTIRAVLIAGTPWLDVFCPGCGTSWAIDLRRVDRHSLASVATLVLGAAVLMVPRIGAYAEDPSFARLEDPSPEEDDGAHHGGFFPSARSAQRRPSETGDREPHHAE